MKTYSLLIGILFVLSIPSLFAEGPNPDAPNASRYRLCAMYSFWKEMGSSGSKFSPAQRKIISEYVEGVSHTIKDRDLNNLALECQQESYKSGVAEAIETIIAEFRDMDNDRSNCDNCEIPIGDEIDPKFGPSLREANGFLEGMLSTSLFGRVEDYYHYVEPRHQKKDGLTEIHYHGFDIDFLVRPGNQAIDQSSFVSNYCSLIAMGNMMFEKTSRFADGSVRKEKTAENPKNGKSYRLIKEFGFKYFDPTSVRVTQVIRDSVCAFSKGDEDGFHPYTDLRTCTPQKPTQNSPVFLVSMRGAGGPGKAPAWIEKPLNGDLSVMVELEEVPFGYWTKRLDAIRAARTLRYIIRLCGGKGSEF